MFDCISPATCILIVAGLIPDATATLRGLMSATDKKFLNLSSFGTGDEILLYKIAEMKKQGSLIQPFAMLFWEKFTGAVTTFGVSSIINRNEGIWAGIKNLGPGQTRIRMYYKESGDTLSVYAYLPQYISIYPIFTAVNGTVNGLEYIRQSSTDTSGMTQFTVVS